MHFRKVRILAVLLLVLSLILVSGCTNTQIDSSSYSTLSNDEDLIIHFIDVGQADCILIELPDGETALIDGGNRDDADLIINYIMDLKINRIDYLIATHPHEDHIGGLHDVVKTFEIGKVYMPNKSANTKIFENLLNEIKNRGLKITVAKGGQKIIDKSDLDFAILAPNLDKYDETNEYSIVNRLVYKNTSFLFTGDAEEDSEKEMINLGYNLSADLLKVGHHGGRTSTTDKFLDLVNPKYAVISVGKDNDYGHPHKEVIERLKERKTVVLRTDELGTIRVVSDGDKLMFDKQVDELINKGDKLSNKDSNGIYYIGNIKTHIYHSPSCKSLPKPENRIIFNSKEEAEHKGYRPHKICVK